MITVKRIKNKGKRIFIDLIFRLNFEDYLLNDLNGKKAILMYHGIDLKRNKSFNYRFIDVKTFEKQLIFFKKNYNIVTLENFFQGKFDSNKLNIAITFDDGYANLVKYAVPLLVKYDIPATIFITKLNNDGNEILWTDYVDIATSYINKPLIIRGKEFHKSLADNNYYYDSSTSLKDFIINNSDITLTDECLEQFQKHNIKFEIIKKHYEYWQLLTDGDIKYISNLKQIKVGTHSINHNNLTKVPLDSAVNEILYAKKYLEQLTQKEIDAISYPYGLYNHEIISSLFKSGLKYHLVSKKIYFKEDINDNRIKSRLGVYPVYSTYNIIYDLLTKIAANKMFEWSE